MRIMHEQVDLPGGSPIKVKWDDFSHFTYPWHYHSEYEMVYVIKSYGTRHVGDHIGKFTDGDLVFVGSNLPHLWESAPEFHSGNQNLGVHAIVIQFPSNFLSDAINEYPELISIKALLQRSERGIQFLNDDRVCIGTLMSELLNQSGIDKMIGLIRILEKMALSKSYKLLASESFKSSIAVGTNDRLSKILSYINYNYQKAVSLEEISGAFGMNPTSFCRFFKTQTSKTLVQYVNEMRIAFACKLMLNKDMSVIQICFECGFNNVSNFNRTFRRITGLTPSDYRTQFAASKAR